MKKTAIISDTLDSDAEVLGLTPGKEYKFRVSAVNSEGESDPLETLQPVLAKNPFGESPTHSPTSEIKELTDPVGGMHR